AYGGAGEDDKCLNSVSGRPGILRRTTNSSFFSAAPPLPLGLPPPPRTSRRAAERRRASVSSAPTLPPCLPRHLASHRRPASRAVSPLIAAPPPSVVPGCRAPSPSSATRVRREKEPQRVDPGAAASIPREKGEGAGEIYFFSAPPFLAALSKHVLRRFVGSE
ncbi:hypothetical protein BDA96_10G336200, partial [Sorghum bicolor]